MSEKAVELCRRYATLAGEIRNATRILRTTRCPEESGGDHITPPVPSCLSEYFAAPKGPDGEFPRRKEFFDRLCDGCRIKLAALDHRRELRRELGGVKRSIERLGKNAPSRTAQGESDK